jgi:hypothetical protein
MSYLKDMKPSAYKSMHLAKERKKKGIVITDFDLDRWIEEEWRNLTPIKLNDNKFYKCGNKSKKQKELNIPSVCRPTKKVNEKTPKLAQEYTKEQIKKAVNIKKKGQRIKWDKL